MHVESSTSTSKKETTSLRVMQGQLLEQAGGWLCRVFSHTQGFQMMLNREPWPASLDRNGCTPKPKSRGQGKPAWETPG